MSDDYLDRLDAAFAALKATPRPPGSALAPVPGEDEPQSSTLPKASDGPRAGPSGVVGVPAGAAPAASVPLVPAALVDEITRLVIARLADQEVRRVVLDTAERLVREEIELIKRSR